MPFCTENVSVSTHNVNGIMLQTRLMLHPLRGNGTEFLYVVVQPEQSNCLGCKAHYVVSNRNKTLGTAFSKYSHTKVLLFAEDVIRLLSEMCAGVISNGLVAVDVCCNTLGQLVVRDVKWFDIPFYGSDVNEAGIHFGLS